MRAYQVLPRSFWNLLIKRVAPFYPVLSQSEKTKISGDFIIDGLIIAICTMHEYETVHLI